MNPVLIVALDFADAQQALDLAQQLNPSDVVLKVGKQLFTAEGPQLVRRLVSMGFRIFLDLKFHDIPNTVASAVKAASDLGVWMVNVHASGGQTMMEAAVKALADVPQRPLLTAVTVLTSMDEAALQQTGVARPLEEQVKVLASLARQSGLDGVVCSAREALFLRDLLPAPFCLVTPGIRPAGTSTDDQTRIMTPAQAVSAGVDYLVVGRPITKAANPAEAVQKLLAEMASAD